MLSEARPTPGRNCGPTPRCRKGGTGNPLPTVLACSSPPPAELLEERAVAKGNLVQRSAVTGTQSPGEALTGLDRIRAAASWDRTVVRLVAQGRADALHLCPE